MKMKKLVALGAAAAMSMAMCVNVFAESEVKNAVSAGYAGAKASYTGTIAAKDGTQMTVVVLKEIAQDASLTNDDIEYINQDAASSALYTNMGTKTDLLAVGEDGSATYAGNYVIRVGYYNAEGAWNVAEGTFTIGTKKEDTPSNIKFVWGDVNCSGTADSLDATAIVNALIGGTKIFGANNEYTFNTKCSDNGHVWGDVNCSGTADSLDATAIVNALIGGTKIFGANNEYTFNVEATIPSLTK